MFDLIVIPYCSFNMFTWFGMVKNIFFYISHISSFYWLYILIFHEIYGLIKPNLAGVDIGSSHFKNISDRLAFHPRWPPWLLIKKNNHLLWNHWAKLNQTWLVCGLWIISFKNVSHNLTFLSKMASIAKYSCIEISWK